MQPPKMQDSEFVDDFVNRSFGFHPHSWWRCCFRFSRKVGGRFGRFLKSFHRTSATSTSNGSSALLWPMPLPFPSVMTGDSDKSLAALQQGVNFCVAVLDWLHLKRPNSCPDECVLGKCLTPVQWRVVRHIELTLQAWHLSDPITSDKLGRAASKVEDISALIERLSSFEQGVEATFDEVSPTESCSPSSRKLKSFFRGLQKTSAGEIVGALGSTTSLVAKPIIADRLEFKGSPTFDPGPFLDDLTLLIFEDPMSMSRSPSDLDCEVPLVRMHGTDEEVWKLMRKLDSTGRLGAVREDRVRQGFQAGLFSVGKDQCRDRLIFDSRPHNLLEDPPGRWISSMANAFNLTELHWGADEICAVSGTDLREFYYTFCVTEGRMVRNSLLLKTTVDEISDFQCCGPELKDYKGVVYLCLRTLAMGDVCAVEIAQTAHLGILRQMGLATESNLLALPLAPPRGDFMLGVVIDDLIMFDILLKNQFQTSSQTVGSKHMEAALEKFEGLGLVPHRGKTFYRELQSEFWGALFEGDRGFVRASLRRAVPLMFATIGILKLGVVSLGLLETIIGSWTAVFLFRRRMLSLLNIVYEALQRSEQDRSSVLRLSEGLAEELLILVALCPLAATFLRTENCPFLFCSDASEWGWAVVSTKLPPWLQEEIHRHKLRKSVWTKLLSPLRAATRLRGALPIAEELPEGIPLPSHPLWVELATSFSFRSVKARKSKTLRHINVEELVGLLEIEKTAAHFSFPSRCFGLADSQVALGCAVKGRSSSVALNDVLQQSLAIHLGCGMVNNVGFVPTESNPGDDPTRKLPVRAPVKALLPWLDGSTDMDDDRRLAELDKWLLSYGVSDWQLSGLPDFGELDQKVEADPLSKKLRRSKEHFKRQKVFKRQRCQCMRDVSQKSHISSAVEFLTVSEKPQDDFLPTVAPADDSEFVSREKPSPGSLFPSAKRKGLQSLSQEAFDVLKRVPREQFFFPSSWRVPDDWRPDFRGYLDLYSGAKGVAKAVSNEGDTWSICFEIEDNPSQDVSLDNNRRLIRDLITSGAVHTMGAAITCRSFSRAVRPPIRTADQPLGISSMTPSMLHKALEGNEQASWLADMVALCQTFDVRFWVENPDGSYLWLHPKWQTLGSTDFSRSLRIDQCRAGTPWRKRTRFFSDLHIKGQRCFCLRNHKHIRLVGWSKSHGCAWTRAAQTYPAKLSRWVAQAILIDSGLLPHRRRLNISSVARQTHQRIGEAGNPGPRVNSRRTPRSENLLLDAALVEPGTAILGERIWETFKQWCLRDLSNEAFLSLTASPETIVPLIEMFGRFLFTQGHSIYILRQLITYIQRWRPSFRGRLGGAWQLISRWESIEPLHHRTPLPAVVYRAMVTVGILWKWYRWAGVMMIAYEGICRPGEAINALRSDLVLGRDLVVEDISTSYLIIRKPKGRRRGIGSVQHVKIENLEVSLYLDRVFGRLERHEPLFAGSPAAFRTRWDTVLKFLQIPLSLALTPASLRAGGAISAYRQNQEIAKILWRMRLRHIGTLQHYLQEVGAATIFSELPSRSRFLVESAAILYSAIISRS